MLLNEIFDTKVPVEQWKKEGYKETGVLYIGDEEFHIILEEQHYTFENTTLNFINVAFAKIVNGKESQALITSSKNAAKILGGIYNAIVTKLKNRDDIDAIIFVARDNVVKRMDLYNRMTSNMFNPFTDVIRNVSLPKNGKMTFLLKSKLDKNIVAAFRKHLTTLAK